jgi:hypothetical protein
MKYKKRQRIWEASNVTYNPVTKEAYSYGWWCFVKKIGNMMVFNEYSYSNTTSSHQSKVRSLLWQLGHHDMEYIESPDGLDNLDSAVRYYENLIDERKTLIAKPKTHKTTNARRRQEIEEYEGKLQLINKLRYYDDFDWEVEQELGE